MAKENPEAFKALVPSLRGELRKTAAANTLTAVTDFLNRLWPSVEKSLAVENYQAAEDTVSMILTAYYYAPAFNEAVVDLSDTADAASVLAHLEKALKVRNRDNIAYYVKQMNDQIIPGWGHILMKYHWQNGLRGEQIEDMGKPILNEAAKISTPVWKIVQGIYFTKGPAAAQAKLDQIKAARAKRNPVLAAGASGTLAGVGGADTRLIGILINHRVETDWVMDRNDHHWKEHEKKEGPELMKTVVENTRKRFDETNALISEASSRLLRRLAAYQRASLPLLRELGFDTHLGAIEPLTHAAGWADYDFNQKLAVTDKVLKFSGAEPIILNWDFRDEVRASDRGRWISFYSNSASDANATFAEILLTCIFRISHRGWNEWLAWRREQVAKAVPGGYPHPGPGKVAVGDPHLDRKIKLNEVFYWALRKADANAGELDIQVSHKGDVDEYTVLLKHLTWIPSGNEVLRDEFDILIRRFGNLAFEARKLGIPLASADFQPKFQDKMAVFKVMVKTV